MKRLKAIGRLEVVSFATGFTLMAYELAAARVLAPSIGSSTYVWTSVIGVIIAALSLGYWLGGVLADRRHRQLDIVWLLLAAALGMVITQLAHDSVLAVVVTLGGDPRVQAVAAALILFAPVSFLLGAISPYLAKLNVRSLHTSGRAVASLGALNSLGGIVGTFATGFVLFSYIGAREVFAVTAVLLALASWLFLIRQARPIRVLLSAAVLVSLLPAPASAQAIEIDTASAHYTVVEGFYNSQAVRGLRTGPGGIQSAVYLDGNDELVFWYTQQMAAQTIAQQPNQILMLGGGAFTLPQYLAKELPDATIDVVEIDPELKTISENYFNYHRPANVQLIFDDARRYVERSTKTYDVILVDVYGDAQVPFSLMTAEYGQAVAQLLKPDGVVVVNLIAGLQPGPCRTLFAAFDAVYRQGLAYAEYSKRAADGRRGNYIVAYSRRPLHLSGMHSLTPLKSPLYTDNYAPAERLYYDCQQAV